jgi:cytochrome c-type biogenesis protein
MKKLVFIAIFLIATQQNLFAQSNQKSNQSNYVLEVVDLGGKNFDISQFNNKAILILFWAEWCNYCKKEMFDLQKIYEEYNSKGLEIIALTIDRKKDESRVIEFSKNFTFPIAFFVDAKTNFSNSKNAVPLILLIDKKRTAVISVSGLVSKNEITRMVEKSLK